MMPKLTDAIQVGKFTVKNRLWAAPMNSNQVDWWGMPTPNLVRLYEERARGGFGLVAVEAIVCPPESGNALSGLRLWHPKHASALHRIAEVIHRWQAVAILQFALSGRQCFPYPIDPVFCPGGVIPTPLTPSVDTPMPPGFPPPKEITPEDIENLFQEVDRELALIQKSGFDGVLLHFTHGFLGQQFMSPWTNHRTDKYGENRALFGREFIERVRKTAGPNFIIGVRVAATDGLDDATRFVNPLATPENQLTVDMVKEYVKEFEVAGADYIDVTAGVLETVHKFCPTLYDPQGFYVRGAVEIKKSVNIPVVSGGKIMDRALAERIVEEGRLDAVFLGRGQLSDPDTPRKWLYENREEDVRRCTACAYCMQNFAGGVDVVCAINPDVVPYRLPPIRRSEKQRRVVVVGGGVAGMEAARVAALCGHNVTLLEKEKELGGIVTAVSKMPRLYMRNLNNVVEWQKMQLKKLNVKTRLGQEATPDDIQALRPDVVILATGAYFDGSRIPGADKPPAAELGAYLRGEVTAGERVIVIGTRGAEAAVSLAREGKKVVLLEEGTEAMLHAIPWIYPLTMRSFVLLDYILKEKELTFLAEVKIEGIADKGVTFVDKEGKRQTLEADTVIIATDHSPCKELKRALEGKAKQLYEIGDCIVPGTLKNAIYSANTVVRDAMEMD